MKRKDRDAIYDVHDPSTKAIEVSNSRSDQSSDGETETISKKLRIDDDALEMEIPLCSIKYPSLGFCFGDYIHKGDILIDKSLFIRSVFDTRQSCIIICRPKGFGKTFNCSMLQHFLSANVSGYPTNGMFDALAISDISLGGGSKYMKMQGSRQVISLSFQFTDGTSSNVSKLAEIYNAISQCYEPFKYLLPSLSEENQRFFVSVLNMSANYTSMTKSLLKLTQFIFKYHGSKPWLLIDDFDLPLYSCSLNASHYTQVTGFLRSLYGQAINGNDCLEKAVLFGTLTSSPGQSITSLIELNYIVSDGQDPTLFDEYFGYTSSEVKDMIIQCTGKILDVSDIEGTYGGYIYGDYTLCNCYLLSYSIVYALNDSRRSGDSIQIDEYLFYHFLNAIDINKFIIDKLVNDSDDLKVICNLIDSSNGNDHFVLEDEKWSNIIFLTISKEFAMENISIYRVLIAIGLLTYNPFTGEVHVPNATARHVIDAYLDIIDRRIKK